MTKEQINRLFVGLLVAGISLLFLAMIREFLIVILLSGISSALMHPLYRKVCTICRQRTRLASLITLLILVLLILLPLAGLVSVVVNQAAKVSASITPWLESNRVREHPVLSLLQSLPFNEQLAPYKRLILEKAGQASGRVSNFLIENAKSVTHGTIGFIFKIFVFLYTTYFFLMDGSKLTRKILYYLPLESKDEARMLQLFTSVTKATLKSTAIIGVLQGFLAGLAFFVVGIDGPVFWGTVMAFFSFIPGVGSAFIWVPAVAFLALSGFLGKAIGLTLFCMLIVGTVDNILRPRLVGKDTEMHDLLIFFGILGGLLFFGMSGVIIGPIIASLFVTVWEIYGEVFRQYLPLVKGMASPKK